MCEDNPASEIEKVLKKVLSRKIVDVPITTEKREIFFYNKASYAF